MNDSPILQQPRFPLNRILALLGPYIALASGGLAAWLGRNFPGLVTDVGETTAGITQGATFIVGAGITWALQHKYLDGWQKWEQGLVTLEQLRAGGQAQPATGDAGFGPRFFDQPAPAPAPPPFAASPVGQPFDTFDPALFQGRSAHDG